MPEKGVLYPQGNAKKSSPHIRTAPSVLKEAGETYKDPSVHYKEKVCSSSVPATHEATLKPRNPRQVKNAQAQARKGRRYTQDDLFNLVELTYDIQDYTHRMPVAFLIHEKRTQFAHEVFMDFIAKEVPEIAGAPFVTDGEENIITAIKK